MRFSYIDSQGKEIEVDSVESLALRIELGAIEPDTRMYDAVADRWAPAEEHPVFRSLSRGEEVSEEDLVHIGEEEGAPPATPDVPDEPEAATAEPESVEAEAEVAGDEAESAPEDADVAPEAPPEEAPAVEELAPAEGEAPRETGEPEEAAAGAGDDDVLGLDFDVTMADDAEPGSPEPGSPDPGEPEPAADDPAMKTDLPGLDDPTPPAAGEAEAGPAGDVEPSAPETASPDEGGPPEGTTPSQDDEIPPWAAEGEALWGDDSGSGGAGTGAPPASGEAPGGPAPGDAGAPIHPGEWEDEPLVESEGDMPGWAQPDEGGGAVAEAEPSPAQPDIRKRKAPPRPAHWEKRRRSRERRKLLLRVASVVLVLAALGGGAAYVLRLGPLGDASAEGTAEGGREVLSGRLRTVMTEVGSNAYDGVLARFRTELGDRDLAERPPGEWLDGIYLSSAGNFPAVSAYWRDIRDAVGDVRSRELSLFRVSLEENLAARTGASGAEGGGLSDEEASRVREAALANFRASEEARASVYEDLLSVADASLQLHDLLVQRESDIDYEPFSDPGVSRDPVLEAVPADSVLEARMNERLDRVLEAVADAGIPRPITTTDLIDHLLEGLREAGVVAPRPLLREGESSGGG